MHVVLFYYYIIRYLLYYFTLFFITYFRLFEMRDTKFFFFCKRVTLPIHYTHFKNIIVILYKYIGFACKNKKKNKKINFDLVLIM